MRTTWPTREYVYGSKWQKRGLPLNIAQNGKHAAYSSKKLKIAKTLLTRQNSLKWQKRSLLVKIA